MIKLIKEYLTIRRIERDLFAKDADREWVETMTRPMYKHLYRRAIPSRVRHAWFRASVVIDDVVRMHTCIMAYLVHDAVYVSVHGFCCDTGNFSHVATYEGKYAAFRAWRATSY